MKSRTNQVPGKITFKPSIAIFPMLMGFVFITACTDDVKEEIDRLTADLKSSDLQMLEPFLSSEACPNGGVAVITGNDDNENGALEEEEIIDRKDICIDELSELNRVSQTLIAIEAIIEGSECAAGGVRIKKGADDGAPAGIAGNGILEEGEVDESHVLCSGENGASGTVGADGKTSLVAITVETEGANCSAGGQRIESGLDDGANGGSASNGVLEAGEITLTTYVCNGKNGNSSQGGTSALLDTTLEPEGTNCAAGGIRINAGQDNGDGGGTAGNNLLETGEIDFTDYVCNGVDGANGADGVSGQDGQNGQNGLDGIDGLAGYDSIAVIDSVGTETGCAQTGIQISVGTDNGDGTDGIASDGILQTGEIDYMESVCNGTDGTDGANGINGVNGANGTNGIDGTDGIDGTNALIHATSYSGASCPGGGQQIDTGIDDGNGVGIAGNGILEPDEISTTAYVCNGVDGVDGISSLVTVTAYTGANCANGGQQVDSGLDNGDGGGTSGNTILEIGEIDATEYICNGIDGVDGTNGVDGANGVDGTNGVDGIDGTDGITALTATSAESAGLNCAAGGIRVDAGLDNGDGAGTANNGSLENGEIDYTSYVCHGINGTDGIDGIDGTNGTDGVDGSDGSTSLLTLTPYSGGLCANGGQQIDAGLDNGDGGGTANNGILESGEIDDTSYVCDGADGSSGGGLSVVDNNDVTLGTVLTVDDYSVDFLTSTGHIVELDWDGLGDATYTYFLSSNCTGPAFKYISGANYASQGIHWGYIGTGTTPIPFTYSPVDAGAQTPASRTTGSDPGSCFSYTTVRDVTYNLTQTTNAAIGLPATISGPLTVE
ncbi:MAG: hypothetical protein JXR76_31295 [Deltaproteobacteria bacterium]|nr:hypothetical protein [Deltaproteobacteria bacterium]